MLQGSIWDKLLYMALPMAAAGILQQLFNAVDVAVVGRYVGKEAMAAVGSNSPVINLLINAFMGLSLGTNVIIAQYIGQGAHGPIRRAVHTSVLVALLGGLLLGSLGQLAVAPVLALLGVPGEVQPLAQLYLRIYLLGLPAILLYNFATAILRSQGDTRTPLLVLTISGLVNVGLNLFFVVDLGMTVDGVAIATVVSNLLSAAALFLFLCRSQGDVAIRPRQLALDGASLLRIWRIGFPAALQGMVFSLSNICVQSAVNALGTLVMAASAAAYNIEVVSFCLINSFGQACTTIVGQNCGARRLDRCHRTLWVTFAVCGSCFLLLAAALFAFIQPLLALFNQDGQVIYYGTIRLEYILFAHGFSLVMEVLSGYLRGFGLSMVPAACALVCVCGSRILWVYTVFAAYQSFAVLMTVYPVSLSLTAAVLVVATYTLRRHIDRHALPLP